MSNKNNLSTTDTIDTAERRLDSRFSCNICLEPVSEPVVTQCGHLYCWPCLYQWLEPGMTLEERELLWGNQVFQQRQVSTSRQCCPVCKAACRLATIVPIYVRNEPPSTPLQPSNLSDDGDTERNRDGTSEFQIEVATTSTAMEGPITSSLPVVDMTPQESGMTGLRQRFRSRDSFIPPDQEIPDRPAPSPMRQPPPSRQPVQDGGHIGNTSRHPPHQASLSHGLAVAVQQALFQNEMNHNSNSVPPLHRRGPNEQPNAMQTEADRATEFLSRLLLMLGSFVILCLLLF